jgi:peptidoglycan hydrolase-like protein with peptidoglycan-binding domain
MRKKSMTRQQKRPDRRRKPARRGPGLLGLAVQAAGGVISRHPSVAAGGAAFVVVFSFVTANAIWYQPGSHPAPLLSTRTDYQPRPIPARDAPAEPQTRIELAVNEADDDAGQTIDDILAPVPTHRVSTITIQPDDATRTASIPEREAAPRESAAATPPPAPERPAEPATSAPAAPDRDLVRAIQQELARLGHYKGAVDGLTGPMTSAALRAYGERTRMEGTPEPSARLLERMKAAPSPRAAPEPGERPQNQPSSIGQVIEAETPRPRPTNGNQYIPPAEIPNAGTGTASATLVTQIQQGLSNIAYADISVDGVLGAQTQQAIRAFESDYRLPETGRPSEQVLRKLQEIGAL